MKKILLFLNVLIVLGVITNSCISGVVDEETIIQEPNPPNPNPPNPGPAPEEIDRTFNLKAYAPVSTSVETYAFADMSGNPPFFRWETSNPQIGFFLKGEDGNNLNNNSNITLYSSGGAESINNITTKTSNINGTAYAYYPYSSSMSGTVLSHSINDIQNQSTSDTVMDSSLSRNILMIAPQSDLFVLNGSACNLYFLNTFAFLQLRIIKSNLLNMQERAKSLKIYIADENNLSEPLNYTLAGNYNIDISKAPGTSGYTNPQFTSIKNTITANFPENSNVITSNLSTVTAWIIINPVTIKRNERLVVMIETDEESIICAQYSISSIERNKIYKLIVEADPSNTIVEGYTEEKFVNKPSNSFIVEKSGTYQIEAKTAAGTIVRGERVEWLWASKEGGNSNFDISELINPEKIIYDATDNTIRFSVGTRTPFSKFTKGNVVLALKNSSNEIVWTWHIWITDEPKDILYDGRTFMDRNIGAFATKMVDSEIDNYGLLYQWGRKDPFIGGDGSENETSTNALYIANKNTIVNDRATWNPSLAAGWSVNTAAVSSEYNTVRMPMQFVANSSASDGQTADWLSASNRLLWSETTKTDFDPCPYGYKVPSKADLSPLYIENSSSTQYFNNMTAKYWTYYYYLGGETIWPSAGMRQGRNSFDGNIGSQLLHSGTLSVYGQCFYWTSTPVNIGGVELPGASHRVYTVSDLLYSNDEYGDNADAYSIRCVKYIP